MLTALIQKFEKLAPAWQIILILAMYTFTFFIMNLVSELTGIMERRSLLQHLGAALLISVVLTAAFDWSRIRQLGGFPPKSTK